VLNVGGGFKVSYVRDADSWHTFVSALKASVIGAGPQMTWNGAGLGLSSSGSGVLNGASHLRELYREDVAVAELREFLDYRTNLDGGARLGTLLADNQIELQLEPGRALLDQAGLTMGRVTGVKSSVHGETLVGVDMNRTNLEMTEEEVFVDPIVIPAVSDDRERPGVYLSGNLCLPGDLLYKHRTSLSRMPAAGDALVFVNSAAYAMDFFQSETAGQSVAPKVAMWLEDEVLSWCADDQYEPIKSLEVER
jgi:diaminopimelate decarboxylase